MKIYDKENGSLPLSLVGMSGGGIWCFEVFFNDDSGEVKYFTKSGLKHNILFGVNYYQSETIENSRKISGVGCKVLYTDLYNAISSIQ